MPLTVELKREQWSRFLPVFSERNVGRPVRVELTAPPGEALPVLAEHQPFLGIDFDPKGSEAPAVEITVGAPSGKEPTNLTHVINNPDHIWVEEDPDGLGIAVEVTSPDTGATRVLFEPEPALPGG
jgi:hypothetical protein